MEKPNKDIFGMGLVVPTVLRATEMVYPEHKRIYDARFDYALLSPVWKGIWLPGVNRHTGELRHGNPGNALLPDTIHQLQKMVCICLPGGK
jgi:hypothetical protein